MTEKNGQEPAMGDLAPETAQTPPGEGQAAREPVPAWVSDPAAAYAEIQKLRDEAGKHRTRANQLEAQLETAAFEKAERDDALDALRGAMRAGEIRAAVLLEAARAGIADPSDALALADLSGVSLGEDGEVAGAREAVGALIAAKPYLRKHYDPAEHPFPEMPAAPIPPLAPTNPGSGPALRPDDLRALSTDAIARMDPDQLRAALSNH